MISKVKTAKGASAISSDQWHVVHSRFTKRDGKPLFVRAIHSEHGNRAECVEAARELRTQLRSGNRKLPKAERDEVIVRRPNFKSLAQTRRRHVRPG